ncbi:MAG: hypothetical protein ABIV28_09125 [Longimicrobiales bacterium]
MKKSILWAALILTAAGCKASRDRDQTAAPPSAAITSVTGIPLDSALALLDVELRSAIDNKLDHTGFERFQRAEALTDRLLETRYPFQWLKGYSYSVESKLRQIQALADRILAQHRMGYPADSAMTDLRAAHGEVVWLRKALREGGGTMPLGIDKLLSGQDTSPSASPIGATEPEEGH